MSPNQRDSWDDARVIDAVLAGDVNRFEMLIDRHEGTVLAIVKKHIPQEHMEDIVQEVFVRAYQSLKKYKGKGDFKSWLAAISVRTCYDFWRKHYRRKEISWEGSSEKQRILIKQDMAGRAIENFDRNEHSKDDQALLRWALDQLPPAERMVLELVYFQELSGKEVARLLGWSVANVKVRSHRARKKLRDILSKKLYGV
jgi:RNA polymerase sigma-70 factor (ECF subfamily)